MARLSSLALVFVSLCLVGNITGQLLPQEYCLACRVFFTAQDCVNTPSLLCQLIAFKLNLEIGDQKLCNEFPCEGYGRPDTHECRGLFGCPVADIDVNGICSGFVLCSESLKIKPHVDWGQTGATETVVLGYTCCRLSSSSNETTPALD